MPWLVPSHQAAVLPAKLAAYGLIDGLCLGVVVLASAASARRVLRAAWPSGRTAETQPARPV